MSKKKRGKFSFSFLHLLVVAVFVLSGFVLWSPGAGDSPSPDKATAACQPQDLSGLFQEGEKVAYFEGEKLEAPEELPSIIGENAGSYVLGTFTGDERWIEIDLSEQKLRAWEGNSLFLETPVSSGLPWTPTPTGEFRIWIKLRATKMEGGEGKYYYYLPNVPYVMYFSNSQVSGYKGYGLHGTYWHNDFGTQRSHGCVNLPTSIAERLFYWTSPPIPEGKGVVKPDATYQGTRIVIHE